MNQASNNSINSVTHVQQDENTFEFSQEDSLFNFSSSHLLDHDEFLFNTILPYQTPSQPPPLIIEDRNPTKKGKEKAVITGSSKRQGKKDRHSKIYTAQGPRDRRMRLSLQIARKFFDLQDMLGFDKASKTIEWLFNKSKAAIKDLTNKTSTHSPPYVNNDGGGGGDDGRRLVEDEIKKQMGEAIGGPRTKESRAKAREWARKRTKEKLMMKKQNDFLVEVQNPNFTRVNNNNNNQNNEGQIQGKLEDQMASIGIIERFLASSSTSMSDFNQDCDGRRDFGEQIRYSNAGFVDVPGNWEEENGRLNNMGYDLQNPNYELFNRHYNQEN